MPGDAWWAGIGPVDGLVPVLIGVAVAAWAFLDLRCSPGGEHAVHQGAKAGAIGAVVAGTTLPARRGRRGDAQQD
ncbi:hypothetical protein [Streptomyces sp. NPDC059861]|uniref:hypothetical protein n=1 Tax=Streptomyces sp. NPDC059861 TaxID=3346974 RepID=UPI003655F78A